MKILVDEHIPLMTVSALRLLGHDVRDIRGTPEEGMEDDVLWEMAQREERLLITTDKGFTRYRTVPWNARHPASTAESAQDSPTHHAGGDAVSRNGLAWFAGRHAGCRAEHLACREPLTQTPHCMRLIYGDPPNTRCDHVSRIGLHQCYVERLRAFAERRRPF
jgi:hypothetical protein